MKKLSRFVVFAVLVFHVWSFSAVNGETFFNFYHLSTVQSKLSNNTETNISLPMNISSTIFLNHRMLLVSPQLPCSRIRFVPPTYSSPRLLSSEDNNDTLFVFLDAERERLRRRRNIGYTVGVAGVLAGYLILESTKEEWICADGKCLYKWPDWAGIASVSCAVVGLVGAIVGSLAHSQLKQLDHVEE